jgi:slit protein 2
MFDIIIIIVIIINNVVCSGFDGKKCEKLVSIRMQESDAYARLPSLDHKTRLNITIVFATSSSEGIILYEGFDQHIAAEIFRGRVRVSFDIGNYPVSTMFSYEKIDNGELHTVEFIINSKNLSMKIDTGVPRFIVNDGVRTHMESDEALYIGGIPTPAKDAALKKWHVRNKSSLSGKDNIHR